MVKSTGLTQTNVMTKAHTLGLELVGYSFVFFLQYSTPEKWDCNLWLGSSFQATEILPTILVVDGKMFEQNSTSYFV
jgi:hypothetical protein